MKEFEKEALINDLNKIYSYFGIIISLNPSFDLVEDIISVSEVYRTLLKEIIKKVEEY